MKKNLSIVLLLLISSVVFAQQTNYQSKVYINGQPAAGQHLIQFQIPSLSWVSPQKPIIINNGVFSTVIDFPQNLYDETNSSREMIINLDGNNIDTVTIYAPIERDPTIRKYIRDSINWNDVHHKPNIDTVPQTLTIKGDSLSISKGNFVKLPSFGAGGSFTVNGNFTVIDTAVHQSFSLLGSSYTSKTGVDISYWQSFQATETGKLRQISLPMAAACNVNIYIYEGIGTSTQYLGFKNFSVTNTLSIQTLDLSSGVNSSAKGYIILENLKMYTFQVVPATSGCTSSVGFDDTDPYKNGISSLGASTDILFAIGMDRTAPPNFVIAPNGYVGIGVDPPSSQLEVGGRIKDLTGWLMPVGGMLPFAGDIAPDGWFLCDGQALKRSNYPDLFKAIGTVWGTNDSTDFLLPDTRGMFLRGVDNSPNTGVTGNDPDAGTRTATGSGGNSGNNVGSKQTDMFKSHTHEEHPRIGNKEFSDKTTSNSNKWPSGIDGNTLGSVTGPSGGSETRPINIYVNYIIKY